MKIRLDKALVERGLAASRERATALVLAGRVLVSEQRVDKPGTPIDEGAPLRLLGDDLRYVSRGGLKLERALEHWRIALDERACVDVGASTGGFTDCMLQHGAASVLAVDTGYGQIAHKLRVDPRVRLRERCNARLLGAGELVEQGTGNREQGTENSEHGTGNREQATGNSVASIRAEGERGTRIEADSSAALRNDKQKGLRDDKQQRLRDDKQRTAISFLAMDVSFISATLVLPAVLRALVPAGAAWRGEAVILIKPQFEAGREHVGKGGIVREQAGREIAIERVRQCVAELGGTGIEVIDSPIHGMEGNWEYLLHARFGEAVEA
jgi:23S rRNA (cytidine1920-2'-O)/16S rRNA (cytidine1409-2'-O)-methyltransferase